MFAGLFRDVLAFFLLLPVAGLAALTLYRDRSGGTLRFSSLKNLLRLRPSWTLRARAALHFLRLLALVLIVLALARPQKGKEETRVTTEGIDIELVVDCSLSMRALDLDPRMADIEATVEAIRSRKLDLTSLKDRLEVVKEVVEEFVKGREGDRIGLTVFADTAQLQCPLTTNHGILLDFVRRLRLPSWREMVQAEERGEPIWGNQTAIGLGLASGVRRLEKSGAKSRVLILLTDGSNNVWELTPETAVEMAAALGIRIYAIGAGTDDQAYALVEQWDGSPALRAIPGAAIDEKFLQKAAESTGGRYFRARDEQSLREIYREIDQLEKVRTEGAKYTEYRELFPYLLLPAAGLLLFEIGLGRTRLRKLP
ncbi:MAG: VWA domain-containing protein [Planctomycetes bacterium]|nr:VWA domain-containing protein [Planctomycetota bacterium]